MKMNNKSKIFSFTLKELYEGRDGDFIHHDEYTAKLQPPKLVYAYANTLVFEVKSSKYSNNGLKYKVFVLFEDFYTIGKDKDIPFEDAIDYAINFGDIHARCQCPAQLYWGYSYIGTQMKTLYGIPRENRYPDERNPNLRGIICKHTDLVIQYILSHKDLIEKMFAEYYNRLGDGQSIYAVNPAGSTITIGKKNDEGDVFFEQQEPELEEEDMELFDEEEPEVEEGPEGSNLLNSEDSFAPFEDDDFMEEE